MLGLLITVLLVVFFTTMFYRVADMEGLGYPFAWGAVSAILSLVGLLALRMGWLEVLIGQVVLFVVMAVFIALERRRLAG